MQTQQLLSLVDYLAYKTHCEYVSDLNFMDDIGRWRAYCALESVPVEAYPLKEWNDALCYVANVPRNPPPKKHERNSWSFCPDLIIV